MSMTLEDVEKETLHLSAKDRLHLVEVLLESLVDKPNGDIKDIWDKEVSERVVSYEKDPSQTFSSASVLAEARKRMQ